MRTLLIDADIPAYKVAAINEKEYDFGEGGVATVLTRDKIVTDLEDIIHGWMNTMKADDFRICLSDPAKNWRKKLDATYKLQRTATKKPALLGDIKAYLYGEYASAVVPWLEADDVMGILATGKSAERKDYIIVSEDKDMRTIPAKVYHPHRPELGVMKISKRDANRFLLWQTLTGDTTDNYPGCPGIGKGSDYAEDLLTLSNPTHMWECVIDAYASKGLTEADAVHQARLACICKSANWNSETKTVRLWNPTHLYH